MATAVPASAFLSPLPATAARPLAGVPFGASYHKKKRILAMRVRCAADDEGEISPFLPSSCRYLPTCSEYSMQAYKRYGVVKGTILTAWRLCRCNPLGGYGYDPPRWFGEEELPDQ
ncbi:UPF0161 protein At3g09310 isoform X4 [Phragmites australis]|uniref:UPF0161 protein At3g09310 isoform X4 n=1 Tax=Phragmites australis TaxID=29695 RepID=UPI002D76DDE5|nr:UPF0161 protein At3g09310 isoform X4 [Phragmites australis]